MRVYFFLDESGDHGMRHIDPNFPLLVLCGVLISKPHYDKLKRQVRQLKFDLWGDDQIIFHSREIRRKEGPFSVFLDNQKWVYFLAEFNRIIEESSFRIISAVIDKNKYKANTTRPLVGPYGHAFTFLVERCVFCLDEIAKNHNPELSIIAESRGADADLVIDKHLKTLKLDPNGTGFVPSYRINRYNFDINFMTKNKNTIGLQIADMMAHPIAKYVMDGYTPNKAFGTLREKIYKSPGKEIIGWGLKVFPEHTL